MDNDKEKEVTAVDATANVGANDLMFPFTNYTSQEFIGQWDKVQYKFPAMKTVNMIGMIPNASPEQIQSIRKKFATDLATALFYQSDKFKAMDLTIEQSQAGQTPALYTEKDLAPFIQKCLEPLPLASVTTEKVKTVEPNLSKDENGEPVSKVLDGRPGSKDSVVGNGTVVG